MSRNNNYTTGNLLSSNLFEIDLSRQTDMSIPEQINSVEKSEEDDDATMLFIAEK